MIPVTAEIVLHLLLQLHRDIRRIGQRLLDGCCAECRHLFGDLVAHVDVCRVMPVVVDHHGLRIDLRRERLERITERRQLERSVSRSGCGRGCRRLGLRQSVADGGQADCGEYSGAGEEPEAFASVHERVSLVWSGLGRAVQALRRPDYKTPSSASCCKGATTKVAIEPIYGTKVHVASWLPAVS